MNSELPPLAPFVDTFTERWQQAEQQAPEREIARRNLIARVLLVAEQLHDSTVTVAEDSLAAAGLQARLAQPRLWAARQRLVFASIQSAPRAPLPTPAELLTSLAAVDGRFWHDLNVFIP